MSKPESPLNQYSSINEINEETPKNHSFYMCTCPNCNCNPLKRQKNKTKNPPEMSRNRESALVLVLSLSKCLGRQSSSGDRNNLTGCIKLRLLKKRNNTFFLLQIESSHSGMSSSLRWLISANVNFGKIFLCEGHH